LLLIAALHFQYIASLSVAENDAICQELSRLLPGVRNVLLASCSDTRRHRREGLFPDKLKT
jgi:hypothetical protein